MRSGWWLVCMLGIGCGDVKVDMDARAAGYVVSGSVSGLGGPGLVLHIDGGGDLPIAGDGAFSFPGLPDGTSFTVSIKTAPQCPQRMCTIANATRTITGADIADIAVTCAVPRIRLASQNWGSPTSLRITDDVLALATGATAAPRVITGASTGVGSTKTDSLALDATRDLIYAVAATTTPAPAILVFTGMASASGDLAPARQFSIEGGGSFQGMELDEAADRLYVAGDAGTLYVIDAASTRSGAVTPSVAVPLTSPGAIALDRKNDRLFIAATSGAMYVFDGARQLTAASLPVHTVTWTNPSDFARSLAIDTCRDRLYLSVRNASGGANIFALDSAGLVNGTLDLQVASQARIAVPDAQVMSSALDGLGNLYFWKDSASAVRIITAPQTLAGAVSVTPDKTINAVVNSGYGLGVMSY